jgi:hypothetical protein
VFDSQEGNNNNQQVAKLLKTRSSKKAGFFFFGRCCAYHLIACIPQLTGVVFGVTALTPVGVTPIIAITDTAIRNPKTKNIAYKLYDEKGLFHKLTPKGKKGLE